MAEYYLISQLPSLDGITEGSPLPITEERFFELCCRHLGKKSLIDTLNSLTLLPERCSEKSRYPIVDAWNEGERVLRLALGKVRGERMKKSFDTENTFFSPKLLQAVSDACGSSDPMEAERLLAGIRLEFLESLRPADGFSDEYLLYYGLKLKLMERMRRFDTEVGKAAYKSIYTSVISGGSEVEQ